MPLSKVISGGQTGADRAGLAAAKAAGLATGGFMPNGFRALDGYHPEFAELYGMKETASSAYPPRTAMNVRSSDATLCIALDWNSRGELLTARMCRENGKRRICVTFSGSPGLQHYSVASIIRREGIVVLNIAGNSEDTAPGIYRWSMQFLGRLFEELKKTS